MPPRSGGGLQSRQPAPPAGSIRHLAVTSAPVEVRFGHSATFAAINFFIGPRTTASGTIVSRASSRQARMFLPQKH